MPLGWLDVSGIPFDAVSLFEPFQLRLMLASAEADHAGELAVALAHHPAVADCIRWRCPELRARVDALVGAGAGSRTPEDVRRCELAVLDARQDWLLYALDPDAYDALPFHGWDSNELLELADFEGKQVVDVGAGTGRLAFAVSPLARVVHAVEPVGRLREYLREKAARLDQGHVFAVDGLITAVPFPDAAFDVTISGHVFGDEPAAEHAELARVTRPGGTIILCPGGADRDDARHSFLAEAGYSWARFEEPGEGFKRKYWCRLAA